MRIESSLVWLKGKANGVDDELFDSAFTGLSHSFAKIKDYIISHKCKRDNRVADRVRKELGIDMAVLDFRKFYQLCHSTLYPKLYPQKIKFDPSLYKRLVGRVYRTQFYFDKHRFDFEWDVPSEFNEINIIPTDTGALDYEVDERGNRTYYFSWLCNEVMCDNIKGIADWFHQEIKGDNTRKVKRDREVFSWTSDKGIR